MAVSVPVFHVSVRELVEQVKRSGDINFRFSSRSNALDGIRGHLRLQKTRTGNYEAEKQVEERFELSDLHLELSGRVDGYYPDDANFIVEEIKTIRVAVAQIPESVKRLHWGQAKVYGLLLARLHGVDSLTIRLCYLDLDQDREYQLDKKCEVSDLQTFVDDLVNRYVIHLRRMMVWANLRNQAISRLEFPYSEYRGGQREMAVSVYKALKHERQLIMQAPTGIGKTVASVFPAIKAIRELEYEKLFFLSAKTSGQHMAQQAIDDMKETGLRVRDITLTAKEKICFTPDLPCDPEYCEYARGYYDKLPSVIEESMKSDNSLRRDEIERIARLHILCPFELSLDLSLISDVIICDYNYVFDPAVYLRRHFEAKKSRYVLLMDESHNLVDRGRDMFSAELCKDDVLSLRRSGKETLPGIAKRLARVNAEFLALQKPVKDILKDQGGVQLSEPPAKLFAALRRFLASAEDWLQLNQSTFFQADLLNLYFDALRLLRIAESADENYAYLLIRKRRNTYIKLYCLNPAPGLSDGFARVSASVCFSATMMPQTYFSTLMGIQEDADWYRIESPFPKENLGVFQTTYISTTYNARSASLYELVDTLASVIQIKPGNYIVFFPSHAYLAKAAEKFSERYPEFQIIIQMPVMREEERESFLDAFRPNDQPLLGFAVMGGIFGEGIDLKGTRLIGAMIVGVGLPQLGLERDLIRDYFNHEEEHAQGFEFAYQFPGINRVLQTAGRVIRSETDRGIVCLIDHRFNETRYQQLLPSSWQLHKVRSRQQLEQHLRSFWQKY